MTDLRGLILDYGGVLTDGPAMVDLPLRAREAGLRVALLSDAHSVPDEYADRFDAVVLGGATGARKPDPEAFRRTAELLGLAPGDCVVVDDLPVNVRGASAAGAVGVRHTDPDSTLRELGILFDW
ncbi:HAD-IA family hydrolase [Pseudonocardia kujensis]|uniref:HAD-IA family hydrolase n=1 Tax=Pseudonocardia kujensis TaxID=1128675 RepID=UPI001E3C9BFC|nr:HAD-IA family hydrolase [Pseudonocardia kujensis]MCE0766425.1 HAD-IA family hydrolase [Pseudonocardia kujensis]